MVSNPSSPSRKHPLFAVSGQNSPKPSPLRNLAFPPNKSQQNTPQVRDESLSASSSPAWNDDEAERRRRRQSLALRRRSGGAALLSPAILSDSPNAGSPKRGLQVTPSEHTLIRRLSVVEPSSIRKTTPVTNVLSAEEINSKYEAIMKMATNNKINPQNTWGLALIDFFSEMTMFRDGESINFQKASCTLDGCAKIYTSRVDSLASETGKLLNGLADGEDGERQPTRENEEGDDDNNPRKAARRSQNSDTLAKPETITVKKFDLEFAVDPLFKKTSADFDEGGARGLLLNHLNVQHSGRIIFDASDAVPGEKNDQAKDHQVEPVGNEMLDIGRLRAKYLPQLQDMFTRDICPTFKNFSFSSPKSTFTLQISTEVVNAGNEKDYMDVSDEEDNCNPFMEQEEHNGMEMQKDFGSEDVNTFEEFDNDDNMGLHDEGRQAGVGEHDAGVISTLAAVRDAGDLYAYFDTALSKGWAGPEHWKLRKIAEPKETTTIRKSRKAAEEFSIDFINGPDPDETALFSPGGPSISLPKSAFGKEKNGTRDKHLLPEDLHFGSKDLLRLFVKKKFMIKMQNAGRFEAGEGAGVAFSEDAADHLGADAGEQTMPGIDRSTFYQEDDDDEYAGAEQDSFLPSLLPSQGNFGDDGELDYEGQLALQPLKPRMEKMKYERQAKRVDVKKLKDKIWQELVTETKWDATPEVSDHTETKDVVSGTQKFTDVIKGLRGVYPEKRLKDISPAFCFICLLHLANEKNLKILGEPGLMQLTVTQDYF